MKKKSTKVKRVKKVSPYNKEFAESWKQLLSLRPILEYTRDTILEGVRRDEHVTIQYDVDKIRKRAIALIVEHFGLFADIYFPPDKPHVVKINGYSYGL